MRARWQKVIFCSYSDECRACVVPSVVVRADLVG
jgi:hypothetical protein